MDKKDVFLNLENIKKEIKLKQEEIISETIENKNLLSLLENKYTDYSEINFLLKKIKRKYINKINPMKNKFTGIQLLKLYPYYQISLVNKIKIDKEIEQILNYNNEEEIEDLLFYALIEERKDILRKILPKIAKQKNLSSLKLIQKYFQITNNYKNYKKTINIINKIKKG